MAGARRKLGLIAVAVVAVVALAGFAGWWFLIRDDAPPEADIATAGETLDEAGGEASGGAGGAGDEGGDAGVEGEWTVDTSLGSFDDFTGTYAGYRFDEELAGVGANTAVGRTPDVSGTMTGAGDQVAAADIEVDLRTLESDNGTRDSALRSRGLETDRFPTATFSLTGPLTLPAGVLDGERASVDATGDLTVHGVTREVTVVLEVELSGTAAAVVGQAPVVLGDFDIDPPTGFSVLSIDEQGLFEFQIFFTRR